MSAFVTSAIVTPGLFDGAGSLSGTVKDETGANIQRRVLLFERESRRLVRSADSASGAFAFSSLSTSRQFFAIAFDDDAGVQYNALIFDLLTPA